MPPNPRVDSMQSQCGAGGREDVAVEGEGDGSGTLVETRLRYSFARTRVILEGLTDDEFFWEPVEPCWSIRRQADVDKGWGAGEWRCEDA